MNADRNKGTQNKQRKRTMTKTMEQKAITWLAMHIADATEEHRNDIAIALIRIVHDHEIPEWLMSEMTARGFI